MSKACLHLFYRCKIMMAYFIQAALVMFLCNVALVYGKSKSLTVCMISTMCNIILNLYKLYIEINGVILKRY